MCEKLSLPIRPGEAESGLRELGGNLTGGERVKQKMRCAHIPSVWIPAERSQSIQVWQGGMAWRKECVPKPNDTLISCQD